MFSMNTGINESKTLTKDISCECRIDESKCNGRITINVNVNVKNSMYVEKIMFGILLHVLVKIKNI